MAKQMRHSSAIKKVQEEKDAQDAAVVAEKLSQPAVECEYEFLKDAYLHWKGIGFRRGDKTKALSEEDINKLNLTNHIKKV